ncbi:MAG: ABC transporter permease [Actinobacteria bacterium]|nr:ABC transporter permease [Actinomycetota bacterium]
MVNKPVKIIGRFLLKNTIIPFFILYLLISILFIPGFSNAANLLSVFTQASFLCILSAGLTFVFINGGIDFSIIGIMGLSSIIGAYISRLGNSGLFVVLAIIAMLSIGVIIGCINGFSVTVLKMPSFIATMATHLIFSGLAIWFTKSASISELPKSFKVIGQSNILGIPSPVIAAIIITGLAAYILHATVYGRYIIAIGTNQKVGHISGLPVKKTIFSLFIISGLFASIASIMMTSKTATGIPMMGEGMIIDIVLQC